MVSVVVCVVAAVIVSLLGEIVVLTTDARGHRNSSNDGTRTDHGCDTADRIGAGAGPAPDGATSSYRRAIRSMSQTFPADWTASPNMTIHSSRTTRPLATNGTPRALMALSTFGATRWRGGIGISFRFAQY